VKKSGWIFILLLLCSTAYGQYQDVRLWTSFSIRYNLTKKWRINLEEEARFFNNISRLDKLNTELTLSYQINKLVGGGFLYRLISNANNPENYEFGHRFAAFVDVQKNYSRWTGSLRTTYQKTYPEFLHTSEWYIPEDYIRILAEVSYRLKNGKTEPYTNIEFWYRLSPEKQSFIDQYRFTAGVQYKINKRNRLDLFYRIQQEIQVKDPLTAHIIGIGYRLVVR
jgi:long-subunit fatty acid transport protein